MMRTFRIILFLILLTNIILISYILSFLSKKTSIVSDIPSISVILTDEKFLKERLKEISFWNNGNILNYFPNLNKKSMRFSSLVIQLTDKPQKFGNLVSKNPDGTDFVYQGFGVSFNKNKLDLFIFVHPGIIKSESKGRLERRFSSMILSALWTSANVGRPEYRNIEKRDIEKMKFIRKLSEIPNNSFIKL